MNQVWKYNINPDDYTSLEIPKDANVLSVGEQFGNVCIWVMVDPSKNKETRKFRLAGTGHPINELYLSFVGTVQLDGGSMVFHLFEILS